VTPTPTATNTTTEPPERTLDEWATDVNDVCREHLSAAGISLGEITNSRRRLENLTNAYDITDPSAAGTYVDELLKEVKGLLPDFVTETSRALQMVDIGRAYYNANGFANLTTEVMDNGEQLGIVSCP